MHKGKGATLYKSLPPRALTALDEQLAVCREFLEPRLTSALADAEQMLFRRANQAHNNAEQDACLQALDKLKRSAGAILANTLKALPPRLEAFGKPAEKAFNPSLQIGLELLAEQSQDEAIIIEDIAARAEARATMPLFELGHRYAVLAGVPILETDVQPFAPAALCACLREALTDVDMPGEYKAEVYRAFDRRVLAEIAALYETLNMRLLERGILAHLRSFAPRRGRGAAAPGGYRPDDGPADETGPAGEDAATEDGREAPAEGGADDSVASGSRQDSEVYSALLQLLQKRRSQVTPSLTPSRRWTPEQTDVNAILGALQRQPATVGATDGSMQPRTMQQLRRDLLAQLRKADPEGAAPQFNSEQTDAIELMSMLFDRLSEDIRSTSGNYLLSELQAPLLRVAMSDSEFFTDRDHAARNWLERVAEASSRWGADDGEDDGDPALIDRIHAMNRTINRDFDGDLSIFRGMAQDLQKQLEQLAHRAEVAERRSVEAARGRERLAVARRKAESLIREHMASGVLPSLTRNMLLHAWIDVLALTLLRHGEQSPAYQRNLEIAEILGSGRPVGTEEATQLQHDIEHGLGQVGMEAKEADLLARDAAGLADEAAADVSDDEQVTRTELAVKLKQRKPIGLEDIDTVTDAPPSGSDQEHADMAARIKSMAFGTWFEFDDPEFDKPVRRKMAWFSTATGRCLFVNRRGVRTHDTTIDHLAQSMLAGSARLVPEDNRTFFERAMAGILGGLKKLSGSFLLQEQTT